MTESTKTTFEQDLERAQHLEQFLCDIANIRNELWKLDEVVNEHNDKADSFDYCDAKTAKFEEVERVRYIRTLIADLQAAF
jgi:hypothetical protein